MAEAEYTFCTHKSNCIHRRWAVMCCGTVQKDVFVCLGILDAAERKLLCYQWAYCCQACKFTDAWLDVQRSQFTGLARYEDQYNWDVEATLRSKRAWRYQGSFRLRSQESCRFHKNVDKQRNWRKASYVRKAIGFLDSTSTSVLVVAPFSPTHNLGHRASIRERGFIS